MRLKWSPRALRQVEDARAYIEQDNPSAAQAVVERIGAASRLLLERPLLGRTGRVAETREWVVDNTPYLIVYLVKDDLIQIIRVLHTKQHWPPESW